MLYFEDFAPGEWIAFGEKTLNEAEIVSFAREFDPQRFHVDADAARDSPYGGLIASGWHTCSLLMRMMCDGYLLESASIGSPGVEEIRWLKPVRPGDTLTAERRVLEARPSSSKPDRGSVLSETRALNQNGEVVVTMRAWGMFLRRPA